MKIKLSVTNKQSLPINTIEPQYKKGSTNFYIINGKKIRGVNLL